MESCRPTYTDTQSCSNFILWNPVGQNTQIPITYHFVSWDHAGQVTHTPQLTNMQYQNSFTKRIHIQITRTRLKIIKNRVAKHARHISCDLQLVSCVFLCFVYVIFFAGFILFVHLYSLGFFYCIRASCSNIIIVRPAMAAAATTTKITATMVMMVSMTLIMIIMMIKISLCWTKSLFK